MKALLIALFVLASTVAGAGSNDLVVRGPSQDEIKAWIEKFPEPAAIIKENINGPTAFWPDDAGYTIYADCLEAGSCVNWGNPPPVFCLYNWLELKDGKCVPRKGHCPHCGAKYVRDVPVKSWDEDMAKMGYMLLYLCPNGHVFWEK